MIRKFFLVLTISSMLMGAAEQPVQFKPQQLALDPNDPVMREIIDNVGSQENKVYRAIVDKVVAMLPSKNIFSYPDNPLKQEYKHWKNADNQLQGYIFDISGLEYSVPGSLGDLYHNLTVMGIDIFVNQTVEDLFNMKKAGQPIDISRLAFEKKVLDSNSENLKDMRRKLDAKIAKQISIGKESKERKQRKAIKLLQIVTENFQAMVSRVERDAKEYNNSLKPKSVPRPPAGPRPAYK